MCFVFSMEQMIFQFSSHSPIPEWLYPHLATSNIFSSFPLSFPQLLENPKLYASYFIDTLEVAGGLIWNGAWMTTQKAYTKLSAEH